MDTAVNTLIATAKLTALIPKAWLADVLHRIADCPALRPTSFLPGTGKRPTLKPRPHKKR